MDDQLAELVEKLSNVKERVIVIEVRMDGTAERQEALSEEVKWLRNTIATFLVSFTLIVVAAVVGLIIV